MVIRATPPDSSNLRRRIWGDGSVFGQWNLVQCRRHRTPLDRGDARKFPLESGSTFRPPKASFLQNRMCEWKASPLLTFPWADFLMIERCPPFYQFDTGAVTLLAERYDSPGILRRNWGSASPGQTQTSAAPVSRFAVAFGASGRRCLGAPVHDCMQ